MLLQVEGELEVAAATVAKLDELVASHDVVFLLTDTRESRWLPSLLCAAKNKALLNVALGMDSYLVVRHGAAPTEEAIAAACMESGPPTPEKATPSPPLAPVRLGCYFCNDVVAPSDSTKDRTLDRMCTVTVNIIW